ncbi:MAG TPA: radical SAM protein, partial [Candidatus Ozemobacteraceae bacterium]|nr:radical SAM protein [Candidatus Ozemobacteraceae bacterium]
VAGAFKPHGIKAFVIAGGPHPTFFPEFVETEGIDAINIGEGELSMLELADAVSRKQPVDEIRNLVIKTSEGIRRNPLRPQVDINAMPLPDRSIYLAYDYFKGKDSQDFVVSRGCPYSCSFCFFHKWNEMYKDTSGFTPFRLKTIDRCMQEIQDMRSQARLPFVSYVDSTFNLDRAWTLEFLKRYRETVEIPFTMNLRPNLVDEEIISAVARTGKCRIIRMGIEVGNESYRMNVLRKHVTNDQIRTAGELLRKYSIKLMTYNMYCLPGQTLEQALETVEINQFLKPAAISSMIFHPYPGLDLTKYALEKGFLKLEDISKLEIREYKWFRSVMSQPELREVQNLCLLSRVGVRYPKTVPLLKHLVRYPSNKAYDWVALAGLIEMAREYYDISTWRVVQQHLIGDKSKMN